MQPSRRYNFTLLIFSSYIIIAEAFIERSVKTSGVSQSKRRNGVGSSSVDEDEDNREDGGIWNSVDENVEENRNNNVKLVLRRGKANVDSVERNRRSAQNKDNDDGNEEESNISPAMTQNVSNEAYNKDSNKSRKFSPNDASSKSETDSTASVHSVVDILGDRNEGEETSTKSNAGGDKQAKRFMYRLDDLYRDFLRRWLLRIPEDTTMHVTDNYTQTTDSTHNTLQNTSISVEAIQNTTFSIGAPLNTSISVEAIQNTTFSTGAPLNTSFSVETTQNITFSVAAPENTTFDVGAASTAAASSVRSTQLISNDSAAIESHFHEANNSTTFSANSEHENSSTSPLQVPQVPTMIALSPFPTTENHQQGKVHEIHNSQTENERNINKDEKSEKHYDHEWSMNTEPRHMDKQHDVNNTRHPLRGWKAAVVNISDIKTESNISTFEKQSNRTIEIVENLTEEDDSNEKDDTNLTECPACVETEKNVKLIRLQLFKNLLIRKLRLDPKDVHRDHKFHEDRVPKLPDAIVERTLKDNAREIDKDEFHARDQELIISGEDMGRDCVKLHATGCYSFNLKARIKGEVAQADLWIYKMKDTSDVNGQTFNLYELERLKSGRLAHSSMIVSAESTVEEGWVVLNVTRSVRRWADKRKVSEMLAVRCVSCATRSHKALYGVKLDYKPLLVIKYETNSNHVSRQKRSQPCDPRSECCKRDLVVNFHEIGLSDIMQPRHLSVGYCYGDCNDIHQYSSNHTSIKQRVRWGGSLANQHVLRQQLKPCCAPLVLKDIFIMTSDGDGTMIRKLLPKVIVESCGCV